MEAVVTPTCPTSFQLRWGLRCRRPSPCLVQVRSCASERRCWSGVVRSAGSEAPAEDSFSGWLGENSDGDGAKKYNGGFVGVGLAGIFLAAGVLFASLSFSGKRSTGAKQQMESLTSQQEALLTIDDQNEKIGTIEENSDVIFQNEGMQGITSGIHEDHISSLKTSESAPNSKLDDNTSELFSSAQETEFPTDVSDINSDIDSFADLKSSTSHSTESNKNSSESLTPDFDDAYGIKDPSGRMASGKEGTVVEHGNSADLSVNGSNLENHNSNHQEEHLLSLEKEDHMGSAEVIGEFTNESLDLNNPLDLEPNANLNTQNGSKDVLEMNGYSPHVQNIELGKKIQPLDEALLSEDNLTKNIPSEINSMSTIEQKEELVVSKEAFSTALEQSSLGQKEPSEIHSHSALINQYDESQLYQHVESSTNQLSKSMPPNSSFSHAGVPAPSVLCSALQVPLGKVLVPAVVDQVQLQAFSALQVLKVIEGDAQPCDICTRREYARWLVFASSALSRNTSSKVYPAMYIENVTDLAFDDITPEDPDFPSIQGLAEAGLISSKLSCSGTDNVKGDMLGIAMFSPESPLSRQDLVSWKMALERRNLLEVDKKEFHQCSGYIDVDKINPDAWPAIMADLSSAENGIISLAFGFTRLFQPEKPVTKAQAAVALSVGNAAEVVSEELTRIEAESLAETAVAAHTALVAEVEKDLNASFEKELSMEREKINAIEKLAEEAKAELEKLRKERDEENNSLIRGRAAVESEMEVLSKLRNEVEEQLQNLISNKTEVTFEKEQVNRLRIEAENEKQVIAQLQHELEVERKALSMARAWAEDEARRAREHARALEEARERWERHGIKVLVDEELQESSSDGVTFLSAGEQISAQEAAARTESLVEQLKSRSYHLVEELRIRAENLVEELKILSTKVQGKSAVVVQQLIEKVLAVIAELKQQFSDASQKATETYSAIFSRASKSVQDAQVSASAFSCGVKDGARRALEDCKESVGKITQKFKT